MTDTVIISDTGCLISLERIGQLDILPALFETIFIPPAVQAEFGIALPWLKVITPSDSGMMETLKLLVDAGEAEAITLAYETKLPLIVDDLLARKVSRKLGLKFTGTIGIIITAKQRGVIPEIRPLIQDLEDAEFYLSSSLKTEALKLANEQY